MPFEGDFGLESVNVRPQATAGQRAADAIGRRVDLIVSTGIVLQELLQGFQGHRAKKVIIKEFSLLPMITPDVEDHIEAAELRNRCRRKGVQIGTIDALIAQLCIRHELPLLTTDQDFEAVSRHSPLSIVKRPYGPRN